MNRTWDALLTLAIFAWLFMLAGFGDLFIPFHSAAEMVK